MSHPRQELMEYKNQILMDELNEFCIALKIWLHPECLKSVVDKAAGLQRRYPKPSVEEIDHLQSRINEELRKDSRPMRRY